MVYVSFESGCASPQDHDPDNHRGKMLHSGYEGPVVKLSRLLMSAGNLRHGMINGFSSHVHTKEAFLGCHVGRHGLVNFMHSFYADLIVVNGTDIRSDPDLNSRYQYTRKILETPNRDLPLLLHEGTPWVKIYVEHAIKGETL